MIEKLDFTQKKRNLKNNKNKVYNDMLSSFAYNKFKEFLSSQCKVKGLELIEINPMYTSLIGQINYAKKLGLSIHQAASYVIARRGLLYQGFEGIPEKPLYNKLPSIKKSTMKDIADSITDKAWYKLIKTNLQNQSINKENMKDNEKILSELLGSIEWRMEAQENSPAEYGLKKIIDLVENKDWFLSIVEKQINQQNLKYISTHPSYTAFKEKLLLERLVAIKNNKAQTIKI